MYDELITDSTVYGIAKKLVRDVLKSTKLGQISFIDM